MTCRYSFKRLWNYLNIYFLKPFDAVNDTITSDLLLMLSWKNNYTEIGSGDGMFSYIMHGNNFPVWFDRYLNVNINKRNIFDKTNKIRFPSLKNKKFNIRPKLSIDARKHHVEYIKKIKFSKNAKCINYENINLKSNSEKLIFFYTPHGLKNYNIAFTKASKILNKKGKFLVLLFLDNVKNNFIFYNLKKNSKKNLKIFFSKMDNGRFNETKKISNSFNLWEKIIKKNNLNILNFYSGLSPMAWKIYDIQTRPILKPLIIFFNFFPLIFRTVLKLIWMISFFPMLCLVYIFCSNISNTDLSKNCYIVFELSKK